MKLTSKLTKIESEISLIFETLDSMPQSESRCNWSEKLHQRLRDLQSELECLYQSHFPEDFPTWFEITKNDRL